MKLPSLSIGEEWKELRKFEALNDDERSIVFYAENKASMNHFRSLINELTEKIKLEICLVTSVKDDPILLIKNKKIKSFYIGDGTIRTKFFLTLKAKILIMDMPDLETFHIKRSKTYPVHYIYLFHSMFSVHSYLRKEALNNFDTIFCVGPHHIREIKKMEEKYGLKPKNLIEYGFGRLDSLLEKKEKFQIEKITEDKVVIIAPSYGENNLLKKCGKEIIEILLKSNFKVMLRPHFKTLQDSKELIESLKNQFEKNSNFILETGVIPFEAFYNSLCLISDWSGISIEYPFVFERPVIFIDVPKKILNKNAEEIDEEPIEISIRGKIGKIIDTQEIENIPDVIKNLNENNKNIIKQIKDLRKKTVYNVGESGKVGSLYIQKLLKI